MKTGNGKKIAGAAVIVMLSIIASRLTGFIRETLIPNFIGLTPEADAYNMAFKITGLMYDLLVGGAIAAALIPVLSGYIAKDKEKEGWVAISTFVNTIILSMVFVCGLGMMFAPSLVKYIATGFTDPGQIELTVKLVRILFPSVAFLMLTGLTNGVLNSYKRFVASSFGPVLYNLGCSLSIVFFGRHPHDPQNIENIAYGIVLTAFVYFLLQLTFAAKNLRYYGFFLNLKNQQFQKLFKLAIPSIIASSVVQLNVLVISSFATTLGSGVVTAFNIADRTWQLPYGIFAQGLGIAILPSMSAMSALGEIEDFKETLKKSLKILTFMIIPSAWIFIISGPEVISTIFQFSEKFTAPWIDITAQILALFSFAMISQSMVAILTRAFYAQNDTQTPLYCGLATMAILILLCFIFTNYTHLAAPGLALAYSLASMANAMCLYFFLIRKLGPLNANFRIFAIKIAFASLVCIVSLLGANAYIFQFSVNKFLQMGRLAIVACVVFGLYFGVTLLLKMEEPHYLKNVLLSKIGRRMLKR